MPKFVKYTVVAIAALAALLLVAIGIVAATFDPNDYKPLAIRMVQEKTQRTLRIPGEISLRFFPRIGADLGRVSISERNSQDEFASIESAKVSLALFPLLSKQLVVDQVRLDGLHATIRQFKDGTTNFDDLLSKETSAEESKGGAPQTTEAGTGQQVGFDIDSIHIGNARITYDDQRQDRKLELAGLNLDTGRIASGVPGKLQLDAGIKGSKPEVNARIALKSGFTINTGDRHYALQGLDADIKGDLIGFTDLAVKLSGNADLKPSGKRFVLSSPQMALALSGKQNGKAMHGALNTPLSIDMATQKIELPAISASFTLSNPGGDMLSLKAAGNAGMDMAKQTALAALKGNLDESAFNARVALTKFSPAAYTFDIGIDKLDLDRYKNKPASSAASSSSTSSAPAAAPAKKAEPEKPLDLSALQNLHANGSVRIGVLKAANITTSNLRMDMRAADGKLDINPLSASLYGGSVAGDMSVAAGNPARITLRQNLTGIHIGPLLKDALEKEWIEGKGNVKVDVASSGATISQLRQALNGSASLSLHDGAVRGINIAQVVRTAKSRIDVLKGNEAPQGGTGSATEKTDFSELSGSFRISNGIAHNEDMDIKSPLIRISGSGDVDVGKGRLDYLAKATIVSTLQGQGGPELQALKGVTIPVRLSGPFDAIDWRIDFAGIATELARQKIEERKEEAASKAQKALGEQKGKVQEQLKERLKGLLGK